MNRTNVERIRLVNQNQRVSQRELLLQEQKGIQNTLKKYWVRSDSLLKL